MGYSLFGLYLFTNPAILNLPGTKVPAGIALKVTEPHKLHHHVKVITYGEVARKYAGVFVGGHNLSVVIYVVFTPRYYVPLAFRVRSLY